MNVIDRAVCLHSKLCDWCIHSSERLALSKEEQRENTDYHVNNKDEVDKSQKSQ